MNVQRLFSPRPIFCAFNFKQMIIIVADTDSSIISHGDCHVLLAGYGDLFSSVAHAA